MAKKNKNLCLHYQVMPSLSQICKDVQKPCCGRGLICAESDKKAQNRSSVGLHAVSRSMPQRLQNAIKKKGHTSYWNSEYMYSIEK